MLDYENIIEIAQEAFAEVIALRVFAITDSDFNL